MAKNLNTNKSVDKLRIYFKKNKSNSYPIKGHPLEEGDEYEKGLYITMLCAIMFNDSEAREEQRLFIERLITGIELSGNINDYIKKALELDDKFAENYVRQFKDNDLKYNFVVDALILISSIGTPAKKDVEFVSEICDILAVSKNEVDFYSNMALGVIEQDSEKFIDSSDRNLTIEKIENFEYYYEEFFNGSLIDNDETLYYYTNMKIELDFKMFDMLDNVVVFNKKNIVFENYIIDLDKVQIQFKNCDTVWFINCELNGQVIKFENCNDIVIANCRLNKFDNGTINLFNCNNIYIEKSYFSECSKNVGDTGCYGGVIYSNCIINVDIIECKFYNCCVKTKYNFNGAWGVIFYGNNMSILNIIENKFESCRYINTSSRNGLFYNINQDISKFEDNELINVNCKLIG
ncbi:right-handed parallel beta-helix repeat-containing protein [Clostridium butyricum]|uniref:right-handed parallel beta-helix repeat-containing protein n=1 Tax=Clostridium butyricum TaxID=1492 RepID=UPI003D33A835